MRTLGEYAFNDLKRKDTLFKRQPDGQVVTFAFNPARRGPNPFDAAARNERYGRGAGQCKGWPAGQYQHGNPIDFIPDVLPPDVRFDPEDEWDMLDLCFVEGLYTTLRLMAGLPRIGSKPKPPDPKPIDPKPPDPPRPPKPPEPKPELPGLSSLEVRVEELRALLRHIYPILPKPLGYAIDTPYWPTVRIFAIAALRLYRSLVRP